jgi:hypothetical protein
MNQEHAIWFLIKVAVFLIRHLGLEGDCDHYTGGSYFEYAEQLDQHAAEAQRRYNEEWQRLHPQPEAKPLEEV